MRRRAGSRAVKGAAIGLGLMATALVMAATAHAESRHALVIGNDRYANLPRDKQLQKAVNNSIAVGDALEKLGFNVIRGRDLGRQAMIDRLADLTARLQPGDTVAFFYAGHGVTVGGVNYLVPSDVPAVGEGAEARVRGASIAEPDIIAELQAKSVRVALLVFDACRDNPFPRAAGRSIGNTRGLGDAARARGIFTIYSAGIGQSALDRLEPNDPAKNSVFTRIFVEELKRPDIDLGGLAIEVREKVAELALKAKELSGQPAPHEQTPAYYDQTLGGRIYLAGRTTGGEAAVAKVAPAPPPPDEVFWLTIKDSSVVALFDEFLNRFPTSVRAREAKQRLVELKRSQIAALPQPAGPAADEVAWNALRATINVAALRRFVVEFPASARRGEAQTRIAALEAAQAAEKAEATRKSDEQRKAVAALPAGRPEQPCRTDAVQSVSSARPAQPLSGAEECGLKPKDAFKECAGCPEMVVVPAGSFTIGSPKDEEGRKKYEEPQRLVTFANPFAVGRFAVTFDEWDACVAGGGCDGYKPSDARWGRGRRPVINVSWDNAKAYVAWLARTTGKSYRLLSEAEREYVTRAGTTTPFWWGASISTQQANYDGSLTYNKGPKGAQRNKTLPVDAFGPNPFGLYQVHGNVYEWGEDCWNDDYASVPTDGSARTTGTCRTRVLRGGTWSHLPQVLRSASRSWFPSDERSNENGFRVARTIAP